MGFFDRAKESYDNRRKINEYNARAQEYISRGQNACNDAYVKLCIAADDAKGKIYAFIRYKEQILREMNGTLDQIGIEKYNVDVSLKSDLECIEYKSAGNQNYSNFDGIIDRFTLPSVTDFVSSTSVSEVYEARSNMNMARAYKERMYAEKERLQNARYAVKEIPSIIDSEKSKIEKLMQKFKKAASSVQEHTKNNNQEQVKCMCQIASIIAKTLTTQFLDNSYQVTSAYKEVQAQLENVNRSIDDAQWYLE